MLSGQAGRLPPTLTTETDASGHVTIDGIPWGEYSWWTEAGSVRRAMGRVEVPSGELRVVRGVLDGQDG